MAARCPAGHELAWPLGGRACPRCRRETVVAAVSAADPSLPGAVIEAAVDVVAPGGQALRQLADGAGRRSRSADGRGAAGRRAAGRRADRPAAQPPWPSRRARSAGGPAGRCSAVTAAGCASGAAPGSWPRPCASCGKARPAAGVRRARPGRCARSAAAGMTRAVTANAARAGRPRRSRCAAGTASRASASTATGCPRPPAANAIGGARAPTRQPASRSAPRARRGPPPPARAAGTTGHRKPAGRRDRCATRVTRAALQHRGPCARCGQQRRLVAPPGPGADTCADCAGILVFSACTECGTEDKLYEKGRCPRCSLRRRARELLSAGTGIIPAQLSGVFDAITAARQPRSALNWLRKGAGAGLLADVAAGRLAISHEALDACPHRAGRGLPAAHAHRRRRAAAPRRGTRPRRAMAHQRSSRRSSRRRPAASAGLRHLAGDAPAARQRRSRRPAAHPHRARPQPHPRRREPAGLAPRPRHRRSPPAGKPTSTSGCAPGRRPAWPGISWPGPPSRGHCRKLSIPAPPRATGPAISQDQRWALTARLLHDTTLDPTDRVAGCLLLLYGQPLSRIAAMTTSQVTRHDDQTSLRLGRHDVPVPGPLASAVLQLISGGRSYRGVGSPPATTWLFPGHLPGRPITPGHTRRTPAGPRHLRPDRAPCRAARPRRPAPRRGPRRPPRPAPRRPPPSGCTRPEATGPAMQPS